LCSFLLFRSIQVPNVAMILLQCKSIRCQHLFAAQWLCS
jgi:hypothetical protein